jgi:hypothetical protein
MKNLASGLWACGWMLMWVLAFRRSVFSPEIASAFTLLFGVTGLIAGLYLFFRGFQLLQRKKWIEDTPVTKIAAAAIGPVKVFGKATGPYTLLSPLEQVDCYYYCVIAWNGRNAQNEQKPEGRATETLFTPLYVEDETGRLMIDPRGAQLALPARYEEEIPGDSAQECSQRFLRRHGLSNTTTTTVTEYAIKPGDPLLVVGTLGESLAGGDTGGLAPYLSPEAADLQRREQLESLGIPDSQLPRSIQEVAPGFDLHPRVILRQGEAGQPFLLSQRDPQRVVDNLAKKTITHIWGGPALALLSLGLLLKWLGAW